MNISLILMTGALLLLATVYAREERKRKARKLYKRLLGSCAILGMAFLMYGKFAPKLTREALTQLNTMVAGKKRVPNAQAIQAMIGTDVKE
jgi:hypothetical protein